MEEESSLSILGWKPSGPADFVILILPSFFSITYVVNFTSRSFGLLCLGVRTDIFVVSSCVTRKKCSVTARNYHALLRL